MSERNHGVLYNNMQSLFGNLFSYEQIGVLFKDEKQGSLYAIKHDDPSQVTKVYESNLIRFPATMGLTGQAI
jgi:hypothetical protein